MDRRIGAQLYTICKSMQTIEDFDESCKKVKEMGYQIVQVSGIPLKAEDMKPILDKYQLKVVVTHRDYEDFCNNLDDVIAYNKILGCNICGIGYLPKPYRESQETVSDFIKGMNKAAEGLHKEGLYLGYHNHAFEFAKYDGKYMMDRIMEETDPEKVKFIVDTYWVQFGGLNPEAFIRKLGKRAVAIHFKDLKVDKNNKVEMAEIGEGNLDWGGIIRACDEVGAEWALVEQDVCQRDPFESLKMSYEYLKTKGFH